MWMSWLAYEVLNARRRRNKEWFVFITGSTGKIRIFGGFRCRVFPNKIYLEMSDGRWKLLHTRMVKRSLTVSFAPDAGSPGMSKWTTRGIRTVALWSRCCYAAYRRLRPRLSVAPVFPEERRRRGRRRGRAQGRMEMTFVSAAGASPCVCSALWFISHLESWSSTDVCFRAAETGGTRPPRAISQPKMGRRNGHRRVQNDAAKRRGAPSSDGSWEFNGLRAFVRSVWSRSASQSRSRHKIRDCAIIWWCSVHDMQYIYFGNAVVLPADTARALVTSITNLPCIKFANELVLPDESVRALSCPNWTHVVCLLLGKFYYM